METVKTATDDNIVIYLVGNKADLIERSTHRRVTKEQAIEYCKYSHFQGFGECSALKNINIKEIFISFYKTLYKKNENKLIEKTKQKLNQLEKLQNKHSNKNKDCC